MHSLLENYLAEVRTKLDTLPAERREEEMREMRQHLLSAFEANRELEQSENEAAANALADFGTPEKASESVLWAWRRDVRKKRMKTSWMMAGFWTLSSILDGFLWREHGYGYNVALCMWIPTMLVLLLQYLPAKYQPSWMCWWFVPSATEA